MNKNDLRYNYTAQSQNFLNQLNVNVDFQDKYLTLDKIENKEFIKEFSKLPKPWICFAVDSTEKNRIWTQKNFALLADGKKKKKMAGTIFVINSQNYENYFKNIIDNSKNQNCFIDCKKFNRKQIINIIDFCEFFVGIDSGP